jgi:hypothetical protein
MGCDIHIVVERRKKTGGQWIGVYSTDLLPPRPPYGGTPKCAKRDYEFFAEIAGVRGSTATTAYPKNLPEDVSDLSWAQYMRAPTDHHSASHATVKDFCAAWLRVNGDKPDGVRPEYAAYDLLGIDEDDKRFEFRVVFWFDN